MKLPNNRNLESLFDMASSDSDDQEHIVELDEITTNLPILPEGLETLDKIEQALPMVNGLEASDQEMDDLASKAQESFDNLMDLGMQVDSRYASEIFAVAGTMLGHAITAKTAKLNKKLKMIDLQLKKAKLDKDTQELEKTPMGQGRVLDRNELLRTLAGRDLEKPATDK